MPRVYVPRLIENRILKAVRQFPVVAVTGVRQTGKSTLLRHLFPDVPYVTLDDPVQRGRATEDPGLFVETVERPCIIDEIQYAPQILPYVKIIADRERGTNGQFLVTGSQIFVLMQGLSESLAGRVALFELFGLTQSEFSLPGRTVSDIFQRITVGAYPDPLIHHADHTEYFASYVATYLERDLRHIENVRDLSQFLLFLQLLAGRIGSVFNLSETAKETGISHTTARRWLSILENSRIVYLLRPWFRNTTKRLVKSPKLYFADTGIVLHLLRYPNAEVAEAGPHGGALFENFAVMEIIKEITARAVPVQPYYYRESRGAEIDLVLDGAQRTTLVEVKKAVTLRPRHYETLVRAGSEFTNPRAFLISAWSGREEITGGVWNVPIWDAKAVLDPAPE